MIDTVEAMESRFSSLFSQGEGVAVLAKMLEQLGMFQPIPADDPVARDASVARYNYALELMLSCKILTTEEVGQERRVSNTLALTQALLNARS